METLTLFGLIERSLAGLDPHDPEYRDLLAPIANIMTFDRGDAVRDCLLECLKTQTDTAGLLAELARFARDNHIQLHAALLGES